MYNAKTRAFDIRERTFKFGTEIVKLTMNLPRNTTGIAIGNQLIRAGTSVGANIEEAQSSGSKKEFIHGLTIALKEARETEYWLKIINEIELVPKSKLMDILRENNEIIKILITIIKRTKENIKI